MKKVLILTFIFLSLPTALFSANQIDINTASLLELEQLISVGPSTAQKIIDARPFSSIDDLVKVKGIGEKTLQKIKDQGLAYVVGDNQIKKVMPVLPEIQKETLAQNTVSTISFIQLLPAPTGADSENEWIKLYNSGSSDINLEGWKIKDTQGTKATYTFPKNSFASAKQFLTLKRIDTNITLNNDSDSLSLISPDGKIIDSVSYTKAKAGEIYQKTGLDWQWTRGKTQSPILPKVTKPDKNRAVASISDSLEASNPKITENALTTHGDKNPWFLFFIALALAGISGGIILLLKLKLSKKHERSFPF